MSSTVRMNFASVTPYDICVRGISLQLAAKIIQRRDERPSDFLDDKSLDKLRDIPGLGSTKIRRLKQLVYVGDEPAAVPVGPDPDPEADIWPPEECTYTGTDIMQTWFICRTCAPSTTECGCCRSCAQVCHAGHHLQPVAPSMFSCDCGAGLMPGPCSLQQTQQQQQQQQHQQQHGAILGDGAAAAAAADLLRSCPTLAGVAYDPAALCASLQLAATCSSDPMALLDGTLDVRLRREVGVAQALLERVTQLEAELAEERRTSGEVVRRAQVLDRNRQAQIEELTRELEEARTAEGLLRVSISDAQMADKAVDRQEAAKTCTCKQSAEKVLEGRSPKRRREDEDETSEGEVPRATQKQPIDLTTQKVTSIVSLRRGPSYTNDKHDLIMACKTEAGGDDVVEIPSKELGKSLTNAQLLLNFYEDRLSIGKRRQTP